MVANVSFAEKSSSDPERRLNAFGLSTEMVHTAFRPGLTHARNRSPLALRNAAGNDVYQDTMEQFSQILTPKGWHLVYVDHQPRLLHPDGIMCFTISSAKYVADADHRRKPRTGRKGPATRMSLAGRSRTGDLTLDLPELANAEETLPASALSAPLWLLDYERTQLGLNLELSQPAGMTPSGMVTEWAPGRILIRSLDLDGDLSVFEALDDEDDDFDVPVTPRS